MWILCGFVSGFVMGLFFHGRHWLGGYGSFKRRLYRLGHISFFGLAIMNLLFYFTAQQLPAGGPVLVVASWGFVIGALSMPACCAVMAHHPRARALFVIPVSSLVVGAVCTLIGNARLSHSASVIWKLVSARVSRGTGLNFAPIAW